MICAYKDHVNMFVAMFENNFDTILICLKIGKKPKSMSKYLLRQVNNDGHYEV